MCWVGIKLCQEVPQHDGLQARGADEDELPPGLLDADGVVEFPLDLEGLVDLLQARDEVDEGGDYEHDEHKLPRPGDGEVVAVTHSAHGDDDEPVGVKEVDLDVVAEDVVDDTNPVCVGVGGGGRNGE